VSLPLTIEPAGGDSLEAAAAAARRQLVEHGALLFRGWGLESLADFQAFVATFSEGAPPFGYAGGASPRRRIGEQGLYSSTEYPPEMTLSLHNELSYADVWPSRLYFFCLSSRRPAAARPAWPTAAASSPRSIRRSWRRSGRAASATSATSRP
jgi:hypothetical protein